MLKRLDELSNQELKVESNKAGLENQSEEVQCLIRLTIFLVKSETLTLLSGSSFVSDNARIALLSLSTLADEVSAQSVLTRKGLFRSSMMSTRSSSVLTSRDAMETSVCVFMSISGLEDVQTQTCLILKRMLPERESFQINECQIIIWNCKPVLWPPNQ